MKKSIKYIAVCMILLSSLFFSACLGYEKVELKTVEQIQELLPAYTIQVTVLAQNNNQNTQNLVYKEIKDDKAKIVIVDKLGYMYDFVNQKYFTVNLETCTKVCDETQEVQTLMQNYSVFSTSFMGLSNGEELKMQNKGAGEVCQRQCTKYRLGGNYIIAKAEYEIYIDNQYGIILKHDIKTSNQNQSANMSWEVTQFETTGDTSLYLAYVIV